MVVAPSGAEGWSGSGASHTSRVTRSRRVAGTAGLRVRVTLAPPQLDHRKLNMRVLFLCSLGWFSYDLCTKPVRRAPPFSTSRARDSCVLYTPVTALLYNRGAVGYVSIDDVSRTLYTFTLTPDVPRPRQLYPHRSSSRKYAAAETVRGLAVHMCRARNGTNLGPSSWR